jgi:hypothetical protein
MARTVVRIDLLIHSAFFVLSCRHRSQNLPQLFARERLSRPESKGWGFGLTNDITARLSSAKLM